MRPEKRNLMLDLMDEVRHARREAAMLAGGRMLRRRRWRRRAVRGLAVITIVGISAISFQKNRTPRTPLVAAIPGTPDRARAITDDELLALVPDTPVGLASVAPGKKRLIFPREGDEARFVTRL
jgi:hypothetical protein